MSDYTKSVSAPDLTTANGSLPVWEKVPDGLIGWADFSGYSRGQFNILAGRNAFEEDGNTLVLLNIDLMDVPEEAPMPLTDITRWLIERRADYRRVTPLEAIRWQSYLADLSPAHDTWAGEWTRLLEIALAQKSETP